MLKVMNLSIGKINILFSFEPEQIKGDFAKATFQNFQI